MHIWMITIGEPLPLGNNERLLRTGIFSRHLSERGHKVTWWSSSFDHFQKQHIAYNSKTIQLADNFTLILMKGCGYQKNISLARICDHYIIGRKFRTRADKIETPDIILCSFPPIELAYHAVQYGNKYNIPIIIDIRDLWPDIFLNTAPNMLRPLCKLLLFNFYRMTRFSLKNCSAITSVSRSYLDWGIKGADRTEGSYDRVFYLGYPANKLDVNNKRKADNFLKRMGFDPEKKLFLFIGSFGCTYDLSTVINGASLLLKKGYDDLQFIFCGDGEKMSTWRTEAENQPNIIFTGWVDQNILQYLLSKAYVGLAAYAKGAPQGIPNKIIEYMSTGLPILSCLSGESEKLLTDTQTGAFYAPGNPRSFVSEVVKLLDDKEKRNMMATNSLNVFSKYFEANKLFNDMEKYLVDIINVLKRKNNAC